MRKMMIWALFMAGASAAAADNFTDAPWTGRLLPLPQEISIAGAVTARVSEITIIPPPGFSPVSAQAVAELMPLMPASAAAKPAITIKFVLVNQAAAGRHRELLARLPKLPNADQAYAIAAEQQKPGAEIAIIANTDVGLLYGALTLRQLLGLPGEFENLNLSRPRRDVQPQIADTMVIPIARIVDWPDIAERGVWGGQILTAADLRWYARWKINLIEPKGANVQFFLDRATAQPVMRMPDTNLVAEAARYGIKILLSVSHLDSLSVNSGINAALTNEKLKHWKPALKAPPPGVNRPPYGICPSSPVFHEFLEKCLRLALDKTYPYHHECCVWLSEGLHPCHCEACKGKAVYDLEVQAISGVFQRLKVDYPELRLRILCSQGVYPANAADLDKLPPDAGLVFYSGSKTYAIDRQPMIPPLLEEFAGGGRWLGVMPAFAPLGTIVPFNCPQLVKSRMHEFAGKNLSSVDVFVTPIRQFQELNLAAAGEWGWNAGGRDEREFSLAYALAREYDDPEDFADWAAAVGDVNYDLAESRLLIRLGEMPLLGLDKIYSWAFFFKHAALVSQPGRLGFSLQAARGALALAERAGNPALLEASQFSLAAAEAFAALWRISDCIKQPAPDGLDPYRMEMALDQLNSSAAAVCANVYAWQERILNGAPEIGLPRPPSFGARTRQAVIGLLALADYLQGFAARDGAAARWQLLRPVEIGEWTAADFVKDRAELQFDVTRAAPLSGGRYFVWLENFDGADAILSDMELAVIGTGTTNMVKPFLPPFERNERDRHCLEIPARAENERLHLKVALEIRRPGADGTSGMISWRRLPRPDELPFQPASGAFIAPALPLSRPAPAVPPPLARLPDKIMVGVISGEGAPELADALNRQQDIHAFPLTVLAPAHLDACDVIIATRQGDNLRLNPARLNRAVPDLRRWVRDGGGLLCHHIAVGFRTQQAVFGEIAAVNGSKTGCDLRVTDQSNPVVKGLPAGGIIQASNALRTFMLEAAPGAARVLALDGEQSVPAFVTMEVGRGRVALSGLYLAFSPAPDPKADQADLRMQSQLQSLLVNTVRWLAAGRQQSDMHSRGGR